MHQEKNLKALTEPVVSDIYIICVPTPFHEENSQFKNPKPDLSFVKDVVKKLKDIIKPEDTVILESTSPIGTTEYIAEELNSILPKDKKIYVGYCPERVLPGNILKELIENDRIIGGINTECSERISEFYNGFVEGKVYKTDSKTAEMCKLIENSYRDTNIAFANEISLIADKLDIDPWNLIRLANKHPRVNILTPGIGVGGHCIAVDPWFLIDKDSDQSVLIKTARQRNLYKTNWILEQCKNKINQLKKEKNKKLKVIVLGLSYKPNIDDLRESPALEIFEKLKKEDIHLEAIEPNIKSCKKRKIYDAAHDFSNADLMIALVPHSEFSESNFINRLNSKINLDFCGLLANF